MTQELSPMQKCMNDLFVDAKNYTLQEYSHNIMNKLFVSEVHNSYAQTTGILHRLYNITEFSCDVILSDRARSYLDIEFQEFKKSLTSFEKAFSAENLPITEDKLEKYAGNLSDFNVSVENLKSALSEYFIKTDAKGFSFNSVSGETIRVDLNGLFINGDNLDYDILTQESANKAVIPVKQLYDKLLAGNNHSEQLLKQINLQQSILENHVNCYSDMLTSTEPEIIKESFCHKDLIEACKSQMVGETAEKLEL